MTEPVITFRNVCYRIAEQDILSKISLEVYEGETLALIGPSGSGKTTLLKLVNGLLQPTSGSVLVHGHDTRTWHPILLRRRIGYVIQEVGLFPHLTVAENVAIVPKLEGWPRERIRQRVDELLRQVGLPPQKFATRYPHQLSGGQKQRVGIARALAADPPILLFDEPFGALDPVLRAEVQDWFCRLKDQLKKTAIFVTHDVREALLVGDRIGLLDRGQLVLVETPENFLSTEHPLARKFLRYIYLPLNPC